MPKQVFEIEGWAEFTKAVERMPDKMKRRELLKIMRRVAKPTVKAAQNYVPVKEGRLKRSIGLITGKSKTYPNILVGPRAKGKHAGFHGHLIEFGHGGPSPAPAYPYMRPAFNATKGTAVAMAEKQIAKQLQKVINQNLK